MVKLVLLIFTIQAITHALVVACNLDLTVQRPAEPLVVDANGNFLYDKIQDFAQGEDILIACPGGQFNDANLNSDGVVATCQQGTEFTIGGSQQDFNSLSCNTDHANLPACTVQSLTLSCFNGAGALYVVGYDVAAASSTTFAPVYTVCFDTTKLTPIYAKHFLTKYNTHSKFAGACNCFKDVGGVYGGLNLDSIYNLDTQEGIIKLLTGKNDYVDSTFYLSQGNLAPNEDMFYLVQKNSTFVYLNAAPQWKTFDEGNWNHLEHDARIEAASTQGDFWVFTGTLGVTTLENDQQQQVEIYLQDSKIPVPRWFWKTIDCSLFFYGYNNPHDSKDVADAEFAKICKEATPIYNVYWIGGIQDTNQTAGYFYVCKSENIIDSEMLSFIGSECKP